MCGVYASFSEKLARVCIKNDHIYVYILHTSCRSPTRHAFDAVLMANVLCRLPDPKAALEGIAGVYM